MDHPNVLFLCSDQHQTAASGCYGHPDVRTPNIDRIAGSGVRFTHAYCQSPVCVPARGSIISGLYPNAHGARTLKDALPGHVRTIAHHFAEGGYQTAAIGKMHFVDESDRHGFGYRINEADFRETLTAEEWQSLRDDQRGGGDVHGRASALTTRYFQDFFFADETVRYLRSERDPGKPFCLWSSYFKPHTPVVPLREYFDLYDPLSVRLPERSDNALETGFEGHLARAKERGWYQQTDDELALSLCGYYGNISQMDACVGKVLDALEELGLGENTIIVYTSDHGEMAGAHRMWTKHVMYEQSIGVPLIVRMPDGHDGGSARDHLVEHVDLYPTLAELCGLPAPRDIHGRSFAPSVTGGPFEPRSQIYSQYDFCHKVFTKDDRYVGRPPILTVRTESWKLNYLSWDRSELFDLDNDPHEFANVIDDPQNKTVVEELTEAVLRLSTLE
jgi:choline-sulfatase